MASIKEITIIGYGLDSESLQLLEGDCLRLNDIKLPLIRNVSCFGNDLKRLIPQIKNINEDEFLNKYRRVMEITKVLV
jgi:hypothetical protein